MFIVEVSNSYFWFENFYDSDKRDVLNHDL